MPFLRIKFSNCDELFLIDREDYEKAFHWRLKTTNTIKLRKWRKGSGGYVFNGKPVTMLHRLVMGLDRDDSRSIDHINGDKLDNRKSNLRICTHKENTKNRKMRSDNTSGFKGVSFIGRTGKFQSAIKTDGKNKFLGYFEDAKEAAHAYDKAAKELHGEFARLNFPQEAA